MVARRDWFPLRFYQFILGFGLCLGFEGGQLHAACTTLIKGDIAFDVASCGRINPEKSFPLSNPRLASVRDLTTQDRKVFYDNYRGLLLKGKIVRSLAVRSGLSPERGVLNGEDVSVFIPPGGGHCKEFLNRRVKAFLDEACCAGSADAPCLLSTQYVLRNAKAIGPVQSTAGNKLQMQLDRNPIFLRANTFFTRGNYEEAARNYEVLRRQNKLDLRGHYYLGFAYRMLENCQASLEVLKELYDRFSNGRHWAQDEKFVRRGTLLYARCAAKLKDPGLATLTLEGFLLDPIKYRDEITQSLSHADFGWIRTSKAYLQYAEAAKKALSQPGVQSTGPTPSGGG